ncbi:MAG TPA: sigma-70 family RNA polymerase sigma factor [Burkholderiaceae bacterium]|nr:sigma-70 family RNA polymerase sigma factor [Burkholderiaceae bacterium]
MFRFLGEWNRTPARRQESATSGRASPGHSHAHRSNDADDAALIERIARGDRQAFESLFRAYHARLARFLGLMTPRRAIVEEALNDTMFVVWRRAGTYNGQSKVSTWIFAIAYRTALKALRRDDEPIETALPGDERASDEPGPESRHRDRQTRTAVLRALALLSNEHRSVLVLTYYHDLPYAEIAQIMACPVDTVKTRMFHARRRLRALLSGEPGDWL